MKCIKPVNVGGALFACGKCTACRITRTATWQLRMLHENEYWIASTFATLTYNGENFPEDCGLHKRDLQLFFKRLRKDIGKRKIKYFAAGEYGELYKRPHYHAILFGISENERELIEGAWMKGFVHVGSVTSDSIKYVASYIEQKLDGELAEEEYGGKEPPFQVSSQGIGKQWVIDNAERLYRNLYITRKGVKVPLPRYYKDKLGITSEQTIGYQIDQLVKEREGFERRGIGEYERAKYRRDLAEQKAEELRWQAENKKAREGPLDAIYPVLDGKWLGDTNKGSP